MADAFLRVAVAIVGHNKGDELIEGDALSIVLRGVEGFDHAIDAWAVPIQLEFLKHLLHLKWKDSPLSLGVKKVKRPLKLVHLLIGQLR